MDLYMWSLLLKSVGLLDGAALAPELSRLAGIHGCRPPPRNPCSVKLFLKNDSAITPILTGSCLLTISANCSGLASKSDSKSLLSINFLFFLLVNQIIDVSLQRKKSVKCKSRQVVS